MKNNKARFYKRYYDASGEELNDLIRLYDEHYVEIESVILNSVVSQNDIRFYEMLSDEEDKEEMAKRFLDNVVISIFEGKQELKAISY